MLTWLGAVSIEDNEDKGSLERGRSGRLEMCMSGCGLEMYSGNESVSME